MDGKTNPCTSAAVSGSRGEHMGLVELSKIIRRTPERADDCAEGALAPPSVAILHGFDPRGRPILARIGGADNEFVTARSVAALRRDMIGAEVLVVFIDQDLRQPVIVGVMQREPSYLETLGARDADPVAYVDGERREIQANREIVLRCGDASITLTPAGKIILRGSYILSQSSGYNKIKGAVVDIN